jgi:hypothetical protein
LHLFKNLRFANLRELTLVPHNAKNAKLDHFTTALPRSICSSSLTSIRFDFNDYGSYLSTQERADCILWSEIDTVLAGLAHQSTSKLSLQLRSSLLKAADWQTPLPRFQECGILERNHWTGCSDYHPLSPHFTGPEPFRGNYAAENAYWETVDGVYCRIEADATIRRLEGSKNRTTDTSSLAEKIRRRNAKKGRTVARPI